MPLIPLSQKLISIIEQHSLHQYDVPSPEEEERMKIEQLTAELQNTGTGSAA